MNALPATFPASARLHTKQDFAFMRGQHKAVRSRYFLVKHRPNAHGEGARLGMAVSRKVSPLAVERNRIKRQIRECFRHYRYNLPHQDILVIAFYRANNTSKQVLYQDLSRLFEAVKPIPGKCRSHER